MVEKLWQTMKKWIKGNIDWKIKAARTDEELDKLIDEIYNNGIDDAKENCDCGCGRGPVPWENLD